jgi:hypothetical protein
MKKCKITLEQGAKKKFFYLAPNAELLYLTAAISTNKTIIKNLRSNPNVEEICLDQNEWIEAEWNGCQNVTDDFSTVRMNYVRLVKVSKLTSNQESDDALISVHFGWLLRDHLRFKNYKRNKTNIKMLNESEDQYNFSELFQDNKTPEDMLKELNDVIIN